MNEKSLDWNRGQFPDPFKGSLHPNHYGNIHTTVFIWKLISFRGVKTLLVKAVGFVLV